MKFRVFLLLVLFLVQAPGLDAEAKESHEEVIPVFVNSEPTNLVMDPPTCHLNNKNGSVHQVLCYGETFKIKATSSDENAAVQWVSQNNTGNWAAVAGATNVELTTGKGIYKAIFTFSDSSTCETSTDTIEYWKAFQIDWQVAACRAGIVGATALPFPQQLTGEGELSTPVDPQAEINYNWQVIPEPAQASFQTSTTSIFPLTDGFFQDTTLGLHKVVLTVSQVGSSCVSVDTMEVNLLPLNVWADTIISYGGQPAIAVAHASGGTEPYQFTWSSADSCLTGGCDSVILGNPFVYRKFTCLEANACHESGSVQKALNEINLIQGWSPFLGNICEYSVLGNGTLYGEFFVYGKGASENLQGHFSPPEQLKNLSPTTLRNRINPFFDLDSWMVDKTVPINEGQETFQPGFYSKLGNWVLSDTLQLNGDSTSIFYFKVSGNLIFSDGFNLKLNGLKPSQILFSADGEIQFLSSKKTEMGLLFSKSNIEIKSNTIFLHGIYSNGSIFFEPIQFDRVPTVYNGAYIPNTSAITTLVLCEGTVEENGFNFICNPGFYLSNEDPFAPIERLASYVGWEEHFTVDIFSPLGSNCPIFPCALTSNPVSCYGVPFNGHNNNCGGFAGLPDRTNKPFIPKRYMGLFTTEPSNISNNEQGINNLIEPIKANHHYFFSVYASPAKDNYRITNRIYYSFENRVSPLFFENTSSSLIPGQWTNFSAVINPGITSAKFIMGDNQSWEERSISNPQTICSEFDNPNCQSKFEDRSYTFFDDFGLFELPLPNPSISILCSQSTQLLDPNDNLVSFWVNNQLGVTFEWRTANGTVVSTDLFFVFQPNHTTNFYLYALHNGIETMIGMGTIFVNPSISGAIEITTAGPFCPGKTLSFGAIDLPNPQPGTSFTYTWNINFYQTLQSTTTGQPTSSHLFSLAGTYTIELIVNIDPADPGFCPLVVRKTILIEHPRVNLALVGKGSEINVCEEETEVTVRIISTLPNGPLTFIWKRYRADLNPANWETVATVMGTADDAQFTIPLLPMLVGQNPTPTEIQVEVFSINGCTAFGEITILRHTNVFGIQMPCVNFLVGSSGSWQPLGNGNALNIDVCSGNSLSLQANGFGPNCGDISLPGYEWSGPNGPITGNPITIENLPVGNYVFSVRGVDLNSHNLFPCPSLPTIVHVHVTNPGNLALVPIPYSSFPNDFKLQTTFALDLDDNPAEALTLTRLGSNPQIIFTQDFNSIHSPTEFELYTPGAVPAPVLEDGLYELKVNYQYGCILTERFSLLGNKSIETPPSQYNQSQTLKGKVFMHHDVNFSDGVLTFDQATVFVRGEVTNYSDLIGLIGFPPPGEVIGSTLRVSGGGNTKLTLRGSTFESVLDRMWGGIRIHNSNLDLRTTEEKPNSIMDAEIGIEIENDNESPTVVANTTFENCYNGIVNKTEVPNTVWTNNLLRNCTFRSQPLAMKKPFNSRDDQAVNQQFLTRAAMVFQGGCSYPATTLSSGATVYPLENNVVENCLFGMMMNTGNSISNSQAIDVFNCQFRNSMAAGIYHQNGLRKVINCQFEQPSNIHLYFNLTNGIPYLRPENFAIKSYAGLDVENSWFGFIVRSHTGNGWTGIGMETRGGTTEKVSIKGNRFVDLSKAIALKRGDENSSDPATLDFTLKCNTFENNPHTGNFTRKGLVIGEGMQVRAPDDENFIPNSIGGGEPFGTELAYPNANVWPVDPGVDRTVRIKINNEEQNLHDPNPGVGWANSPNWIAIDNQSGETITYWRYDNEFVGWGDAIEGTVNRNVPQSKQKFRTHAQTLLHPNDPNYVDPLDNSYDQACGISFDEQPILFPARIAVIDSSEIFTAIKTANSESMMLGDAIPNPASDETRISILLPGSVQQAVLQFVDVGSGQLLQTIPIAERGKLEAILDLRGAISGIFGYRLIVDGKPIGTRKLVVVK